MGGRCQGIDGLVSKSPLDETGLTPVKYVLLSFGIRITSKRVGVILVRLRQACLPCRQDFLQLIWRRTRNYNPSTIVPTYKAGGLRFPTHQIALPKILSYALIHGNYSGSKFQFSRRSHRLLWYYGEVGGSRFTRTGFSGSEVQRLTQPTVEP